MVVSAIRERPKLDPDNQWLYEAYYHLTRSRQLGGMGEYYIPLTEYQAYCSLFGITDTERIGFLINVITLVDNRLLSERYKEIEAKSKSR